MIGAGSMKPDLLAHHIARSQEALGDKPFAVNIPLERKDSADLVGTCIQARVKIVFTSAGNPGLYTAELKSAGITVAHVVPSPILAKKAEERGVDVVVCEGTEAGGHNGIDEIPTFALVPLVCDTVSIPVIAAGGIVDGRHMAAALALGAEGVQIGTRFAATIESSAHPRFKQAMLDAGDTDTVLTLKNVVPVRMLKSPFALRCIENDKRGASREENIALLGHKREQTGMFDGNWEEGQFEVGMGVGMIKDIPSAETVVSRIISQYNETVGVLNRL